MDTQHEEKERSFLSSLSENHELALRRLSEKHRDRLASIDKSFLQQKQTVRTKKTTPIGFLHHFIMNNLKLILKKMQTTGYAYQRSDAVGARRTANSRETSAS